MTEYLHHVPGRLRLRARLFRHASQERSRLLRELRTREGVRDVRLNEKAASVTIFYDSGMADADDIMSFIGEHCAVTASSITQPSVTRVAKPAAAAAAATTPLVSEIGRVALSVIVSKGVNYSLSSLLRARI
ncbi:MAG TPA: hypothetical protein VJ883_08275 [Woeseiaceae bacterium]|nr:hypothetical protein [Woeseiaceae bacterium]